MSREELALQDLTSLDGNPGAWYVPQDDQPPAAPPPTRELSPEPADLEMSWVERIKLTKQTRGREDVR